MPAKRRVQSLTNQRLSQSSVPILRGSVIRQDRVSLHRMMRVTPIRDLKPQKIARMIDDFEAGYLREFAQMMDAVQRRDDELQTVIPKRLGDVSRHEYQVLVRGDIEDSQQSEAEDHKNALNRFYSNVETRDAIDLDSRGGFRLLVEQMLDAQAKRWAAHEVLWRPSPNGITAVFNHVPLWWFEKRTGRLRYLEMDYQTEGVELDPGGWMVTCGQGIMEACVIAYLYKTLSLRDWLLYGEKHAMPGIVGKTNANKGSAKWLDMIDAVQKIAADYAVVINEKDSIDKVSFSAEGQLPYQPLVEAMNKAMTTMWRGADLSTLSAGPGAGGQGASVQEGESDIVEQRDALLVSETLNAWIDPLVIRWTFGEGVTPLAYVRIVVPEKQDLAREIQVDEFLSGHGVELSQRDARERYGREEPKEGEDVLGKPEPVNPLDQFGRNGGGNGAPPSNGKPSSVDQLKELFASNERTPAGMRVFMGELRELFRQARGEHLRPLLEKIKAIEKAETPEAFANALRDLQDGMEGEMKRLLADKRVSSVLEKALASAYFSGAIQPAKSFVRKTAHRRS
jgi:phage gp29-like protein